MKFISIREKLVKLITKLIIAVVAIFLFSASILGIITALRQLSETENWIKGNLISKGKLLVANNSIALRGMVEDNAFKAIQELVSSTVRVDNDVERGIYMDLKRQPWVHVSPENPEGIVDETGALNDSISLWVTTLTRPGYKRVQNRGGIHFEFAAPIEVEGSKVGTIQYLFNSIASDKAIKASKISFIVEVIIFGCIMIFLTIAIYLFTSRTARRQAENITKPLGELAEAANLIAQGKYNHPIVVKTDDEVGTLAQNFEEMRQVVKEYTDNLERLIANKTEQLRETMEDLARSNKELEQFAYIASHDLQEPLRMVTSYLGLIKKKCKDMLDKDSHEFIEFAVDGAVRMRQLIVDLLKYSRVGTKGKPFVNINCEKVIEKATKNLEIAIEEHKAVVTHDTLPTITADEGQLAQLFQNIIGNALKFCKDRTPEIHVSATQKEKEWEFSIKDNGIGIPPENQERVFQIFQRLHTREEYEGTGIGLAVCQKIVTRHGGTMWVESEVGQGTTFLFTIPFILSEEEDNDNNGS